MSFLVGSTLLQVCAGENEVILNLHGDVSIMIAGDVRRPLDTSSTVGDSSAIAKAFMPYLGHSIVEAQGFTDGTLRLTWTDGSAIEILDSWAEYESYTITHGDETLVV